jgi:flagellar L-ring protein precursor FlgH
MLRFRHIVIICFGFLCASIQAEDLFSDESFTSFTSDKKAHRIGDTVTILIVERSAAESRANTATDKSYSFKGSASDSISQHDVAIGLNSGASGDAITRRNGFVSGQITVTVKDVNTLGHLVVDGQQNIIVNGEDQSIKVKGTLRQEDILANNTALSTRLTNAKIEFIGEGVVSEIQKKGLISTILGWFRIP